MSLESVKAKESRLLVRANSGVLRRVSPLPLQPCKHRSLICPGLRVPDNLNVFSILLLLFLSPTISFLSSLEDEKGLASIDAVCIDADLKSGFPLVPATSRLLNPNSLCPFVVIRPSA